MNERRPVNPERTRPGRSRDTTVDDAARGLALGTCMVDGGMFDHGLPAAVDTLARAAFYAGLAAGRLEPRLEDPEAFYYGLIQGIQEAASARRET
jgi:hypothetical protein